MKTKQLQKECGIALLIVIIALLLVTAVAAGMILLSNPEITIDANYRDEQVALYAAKAGLEEARDRVLPSNANPITLPTALPGSTGGAVYIYGSGVSPWLSTSTKYNVSMYDTEFGTELTAAGLSRSGSPWYTSYATNTNYSGPSANPLPYQWVRINLKTDASETPYSVDGISGNKAEQVCYDMTGLHEVVISAATCAAASPSYQPVYDITSFALTPNLTRRTLQEELVKDTINLNLPGALTIDGTVGSGALDNICSSGSTCNGGGAYLTGNNPASCTTGSNIPALATADPTSTTNLTTDISANKTNIVGNGGSPSVVNESSTLTNLNTVTEIEALVQQMKTLAGSNVCTTSCGSLSLGTSTNPTITVVDNAGGSAFQLNSGTTGYGILVVTGTLDYVNVNSYQGVILMLGTAQFISSSSKDTTFTGALFMAQDRSPTTGALLPGPGLGSPTFNFHHGSASSSDPSIQYNSCVVSQVESAGVTNYRVLAQRQLAY